jgi:hypothetical protein
MLACPALTCPALAQVDLGALQRQLELNPPEAGPGEAAASFSTGASVDAETLELLLDSSLRRFHVIRCAGPGGVLHHKPPATTAAALPLMLPCLPALPRSVGELRPNSLQLYDEQGQALMTERASTSSQLGFNDCHDIQVVVNKSGCWDGVVELLSRNRCGLHGCL